MLFLCAYLTVRRRNSRKQSVLDALYWQGADDRATEHPFSLKAIHEVAISHEIDRLEAHEAYRRGFVDTDSKFLLRDMRVLKTQLHKLEDPSNARSATNPTRAS